MGQTRGDIMNTTRGPAVRLAELPAFDCWHLIESVEISRVAWNGPQGVSVVPVNHVVSDGALWFRTTPYSALALECRGQWVAAEVDSVDPATHTGWSVVVRGVAELVDAEDVPEQLADFRVWPAGTRNVFVRVEPVEVTGRKLVAPHVG
jgi:hypothetical protein